MPGSTLTKGTLVAGRYRLNELLGQGGMGVVWAATHTVTEREVALKFLQGPAHLQGQLRQRFLREARAASAVQHPNVVDVLDVFELDEHTPVMVLERLHGETLGQRLARVKTRMDEESALENTLPEQHAPPRSAAALSLEATAALFVPIVAAVGTAHARGIVHRDLKPDNIFIERDANGVERVKVLDFGVAKLMEGGTASGMTETGAIVGTPCYMAPEQALGDKLIDHRVDVWALGVILYECLSGKRPVEGDSIGRVVLKITTEGVRPLGEVCTGVPPDVNDAVGRMLERDRALRPELADVLGLLERYTNVRAPLFSHAGDRRSSEPARTPSARVDAQGPTELAASRPQTGAGHALPTVGPATSKRSRPRLVAGLLLLAGLAVALVLLATRTKNLSKARPSASVVSPAASAAAPPLRSRMLTALPPDDPIYDLDLSRDGAQYVYQSVSGVWLAQVKGGAPQRLAHLEDDASGSIVMLALMPDQRTLALLRETKAGSSADELEVVLVPLHGGSARSLSKAGVLRGTRSPAMRPSPNGREIAVAASGILVAIDVESGASRTIVSRAPEEVAVVDWSPDSSRLAYVSGSFWSSSPAELRVVRADGRDDRSLLVDTRLYSGRSGAAVVWLDDRRLALSRLNALDEDPGGGIWELDVGAPSATAGAPRLLRRRERFVASLLRYSAATRRLAAVQARTQCDVYVGELAPGATALTKMTRVTLNDSDDRPSEWLGDGRILFMSDRYGSLDVLAQRPGSPEAESLAGTRAWESWPRMLGRSVAFWRFDVGGDAGARPVELVRIDEAGREQRVLEQTMGTEHGRESTPPPTDKQFGCARRAESVCIFGEYKSGAFALHRLDPKTGNLEHPLYQRAASKAATFDVSPDGRTVAMVGLEVGGLLLISLANGDAREIKLGDGLWQSVHWTPDGAGLMLTGMGNRGHNFVIVHADLRGNTKLLHSSNSRWFTQAIPSPDGKRLAFGEMTHERNVELTEGL